MENRAVDPFNDVAGGKKALTADKGGTKGDVQGSKIKESGLKGPMEVKFEPESVQTEKDEI